MQNSRNGLSTVFTWFIVGIAAIFAVRISFMLLGPLMRVALFLLFTFGPILLAGWIVVRILRRFARA